MREFLIHHMSMLLFVVTMVANQEEGFIHLNMQMESVMKNSGKIARFNCEITGNPLPKYTWYKDGVEIHVEEETRIFHERYIWGSRLKIVKLRMSDSGDYTCEANNSAGTVRTSASLHVLKEKVSDVVVRLYTSLNLCNIYEQFSDYGLPVACGNGILQPIRTGIWTQICRPIYFITAPNVLRYNSPSMAIISIFGIESLEVNVWLEDYPNRQNTFSQSSVIVHKGTVSNATLMVTPSDIPNRLESDRYVYLVASSTDERLTFTKETLILVSGDSGYIFIQMDKPIYTPDQKVKFRVIPLGENRRPSTYPVLIDIKNPQGVVVFRRNASWTDRFIVEKFQLPPIPFFGNNWTITAKYQNGLDTSTTIQFEVKEYVLPRFSVDIDILDGDVILPNTQNISFIVNASFVYDKPVIGEATVVFAIIADDHHETCPFRLKKQLTNGTATFSIDIVDIQTSFESFWFPDGARLYIEAEVIEESSGRKERGIDKSIVFALSPYILSVKRSQRSFKPGLLYELKVDTLMTNGEPAPHCPLTVTIERIQRSGVIQMMVLEGTTDDNGQHTFFVVLQREDDTMNIKVKTADTEFERTLQAELIFQVLAASSASRHYLGIWPEVNENNELVVQTWHTDTGDKDVQFLLLSQGRILGSGITGLTDNTTYNHPLDASYAPTTRIVAFYISRRGDNYDVVADSSIVNVQNSCHGKELDITTDRDEYKPGDPLGMNFEVTGTPNSLVGLLAVDKAVYLMKDKNRLQKETMLKRFQSHDTGCGLTDGRNNREIFQNAGLAVLTNANMDTDKRESMNCENRGRGKRSINLERFSNHPCCVAAEYFAVNDTIIGCFEQGKVVKIETNSSQCAKVFYYCCQKFMPAALEVDIFDWDRTTNPGQVEYTFSDINTNDGNTKTRSYFPESWLFTDGYLDETGTLQQNVQLPDSITKHVIQAISISSVSGMCIAEPKEIKTMQDFFVDLDLPYSMVRMEQTEVRATIYNYQQMTLPCYVILEDTEGICASKTSREYVRITVPPNDAEMVRFTIVPLHAGEFNITIKVFSVSTSDIVQKKIFVINEGREETKKVSFRLDPNERLQHQQGDGDLFVNIRHPVTYVGKQETTVDLTLPNEAIPGTEKCRVSAIGNIMDSTVKTVIGGIDRFLDKVPHGCGEQTMILLAPVVYAMRYLQRTNQMTPELERRGIGLMRMGYQRELIFRKQDGSFSVWPHKPSSTWLTAFVLKVFSEAQRFIDIDPMVICSGMEWLLSRQRADGSFVEMEPVYHKNLMGGINGDASMTAFILIALLESRCRPAGTQEQIIAAMTYLETKVEELNQPYSVAIVSYALSLLDSPHKHIVNEKLRSLSKCKNSSSDNTNGLRYWSTEDEEDQRTIPYWYRKDTTALTVETTAYALLTQLTLDELSYSHNIVEWLIHKRKSSGAFISTQDTVVGLQALSLYNIRTYASQIDMESIITASSNNSFEETLLLTEEDTLIEKSVHNVPVNGKLEVDTQGSGLGLMEVEVRYNVNISEHDRCKFDIEVVNTDVQFDINAAKGINPVNKNCDACGYCEDDTDENDYSDFLEKYNVPDLDPRIWAGSRFGRSVRSHGASKVQECLEICTSYLGSETLDMPVIDVGIPTGFRIETDDLQQLKEKEQVNNFEVSKRSVTFYLDTIPTNEELCLRFRVVKEFEVENLQAAKIEVYDFYREDERCVKFYSLKYEIAQLDIFCTQDTCRCVEGNCAESWDLKLKYGQLHKYQLFRYTCYEYDYVIHIEVTNAIPSGNHLRISAIVRSVVKQTDENLRANDEIDFWMNLRCSSVLIPNEAYIIFGKKGIKYIDETGSQRYRYYLQGDTGIIKDYSLRRYATNAKLRSLKDFIRNMESHIRRVGC